MTVHLSEPIECITPCVNPNENLDFSYNSYNVSDGFISCDNDLTDTGWQSEGKVAGERRSLGTLCTVCLISQ